MPENPHGAKPLLVTANSAVTHNPTPHKIVWTAGTLAGDVRQHG